jgi:vang-like
MSDTRTLDDSQNESERLIQERQNKEYWANENETFATSEATSRVSNEELLKFRSDRVFSRGSCPSCSASVAFSAVLFLVTYASPVCFLVIPKAFGAVSTDIPGFNSSFTPPFEELTDIGSQGDLIAIAVKLVLLLAASWVFLSSSSRVSRLPSINLYRFILSTVSFATVSIFWLFYAFKVVHWGQWHFTPIVRFTSAYVDVLLFLHYFGVVVLYLRHKNTCFLLEVTRSTDGETRFYNAGPNSIQATGAYILQKYYRDFSLYNPALSVPSRSTRMRSASSFKVYSIDQKMEDGQEEADKKAILTAAARRRDAGQNERYFSDVERERRVRKRRSRLECAVDDAFSLVHRNPSSSKSAREVAEEVWPTMARSMQKYLRTTRQHQHFSQEDVLDHLSFCFRHSMSSAAFLSRYLAARPGMTYPGHILDSAAWSISCDEPLLSAIRHGISFSLIQSDYTLVCTVRRHPNLVLREEYHDPKSFRYQVDLNNPESPV